MGNLYIVSTPIGNLQDITIRALDVLSKVDVIACEDTRRTGIFLKELSQLYQHVGDHRPVLLSYYEQNEFTRIPQIISQLKSGYSIALISDAGTPAISDPGYKLIRECISEGITVEVIPGPSASIAALTISGLPTDKFLFLGYLPHKSGHRKMAIEQLKQLGAVLKQTIILYEAPHKLLGTLNLIQEVYGDISVVLCRELTKIHEEIRREKISESLEHFKKVNPKGEFVILFSTEELLNSME